MRDDLQAVFGAIRTLSSVRDQIGNRLDSMRAAGIDLSEIEPAAKSITEHLGELELLLWNPKIEGYNDIHHFVAGYDTKVAYLYDKVDSSDHRPTTGQRLRYEELHAELEKLFAQLEEFYASDVAALGQMMRDSGAMPVQMSKQQR